jgi:hypothetical protein
MERKYYKLVDRVPVLTDMDDAFEHFYDRQVCLDVDVVDYAPVDVSTVFLTVDHNHFPELNDGLPILFETMVFGGEHNEFCVRCSTYEQAVAQHQRTVSMVKGEENA